MRSFLAFIMASVLLACPLLCQAEEVACCEEHGQGAADRDLSGLPAEDPSDCGSCICDGAVKDASLRNEKSIPSDLPPAPGLLPAFCLPPPLYLSARCPRCGGPPPDWLAWHSSPRVHALLQNFRC